jgi:hypothetical protein
MLQQENQQAVLDALNSSAAFTSIQNGATNELRNQPFIEGDALRFELNSDDLESVFHNEVNGTVTYPAFYTSEGRAVSARQICGRKDNGLDDFFTETTYSGRVQEFIQKLMDNNAIVLTIDTMRRSQSMRNGKLQLNNAWVFGAPVIA